MERLRTVALGAALGLSACASSHLDETGDGGEALRDRAIRRGLALYVEPGSSEAAVSASVRRGDFYSATRLPLGLAGGALEVAVSQGGDARIDGFELGFDDVVIEDVPAAPGGRIHLTDVSVGIDAPSAAPASWSTAGDRLDATVALDLVLDWSLVGEDGELIPLGAQRLASVDVALVVTDAMDAGEADGAGAALELALGREGQLWEWADLVHLTDLAITARGSDRPPFD